MFFSRLGRWLAIAGFLLGGWKVGAGVVLASRATSVAESRAFAQMYLAAATTGEAIDEGLVYCLIAIVVGILSEIGLKLGARRT